jgi:uncharacterized lipoprotein YmbA
MKKSKFPILFTLLCGVALLAVGCLLKHDRVTTREFVLTAMPNSETRSGTARPIQIEVGFVKMPSYLLRQSLAVRQNAGEFKYLENAQWAERLDQGFRRILTENLSSLLASGSHPTSGGESESKIMLSVDVQQFDVDTNGNGTLLATWRLSRQSSDELPKSGQSHFQQSGPAPKGNPQAISATLSDLIAQFSRELAAEIRKFNQVKGN